jgi:hypothetical protein
MRAKLDLEKAVLADALVQKPNVEPKPPFQWLSAEMGAKVDFSDKDALHRELDKSWAIPCPS